MMVHTGRKAPATVGFDSPKLSASANRQRDDRLWKSKFLSVTAGVSIPTSFLEQEPATQAHRLERFDKEGDGQIAGANWRLVFDYLRRISGSKNSAINLTDSSGRASAAYPVLLGLAKGICALADWLSDGAIAPDMSQSIVHVGMSINAPKEHKHLLDASIFAIEDDGPKETSYDNGRGKQKTSSRNTIVSPSGRVVRLNRTSIDNFVATLPVVDKSQLRAVLFKAGDKKAERELVQLASLWSRGQRGGEVPGKLILSGHSDGYGVHGGAGDLTFEQVRSLAKLMPKAAAQIKHLHLSGCQTGYDGQIEAWRDAFPNLVSITGFSGTASSSLAGKYQKQWHDLTNRPKLTNKHLGQIANNTATWTKNDGFTKSKNALAGDALLARLQPQLDMLKKYMSGERKPTRGGQLLRIYTTLKNAALSSGIDDDSRFEVELGADQALGLRYHKKVLAYVERVHGSLITSGCKQLGVPRPKSLTSMSRKEVVTWGKKVESAERRMAAQELISDESPAARAAHVIGVIVLSLYPLDEPMITMING